MTSQPGTASIHTTTTPWSEGLLARLHWLLPDHVTRYTRLLAWLTLIVHIGIIVTGGLVRLTGSGLGCPTWPKCTEESLVPTAEMGWHGAIEFGNRTLTGLLCFVALLTYLAVVRTRASGRRLAAPALWIGLLTILQALVGGLTVLMKLNPGTVGVHFLISMGLVSLASLLLVRVLRDEPAPVGLATRPSLRGDGPVIVAAALSYLWTWVTVFLGTLTTGSGPHAGDADAARNGLDPEFLQHLHAYPAYILLACAITLLLLSAKRGLHAVRNASAGLILALIAQAGVGIWQARAALPINLVILHMGLSAIIMSLVTITAVLLHRTSRRSEQPAPREAAQRENRIN